LILRDRSVSGTLDVRLYAMQDANWNVTGIVNTTGAVQERYNYSAYGALTFLNSSFNPIESSEFEWETTYCVYRYDVAVDAQLVRNRWLSSTLGCWLSTEDI
jgi:hypothetical protein